RAVVPVFVQFRERLQDPSARFTPCVLLGGPTKKARPALDDCISLSVHFRQSSFRSIDCCFYFGLGLGGVFVRVWYGVSFLLRGIVSLGGGCILVIVNSATVKEVCGIRGIKLSGFLV